MRIQLHHNYEKTLIELSTNANMSPTDYIKMLLLNKVGVINSFTEANAIAQDLTNDNKRKV